MNYDPDIFDFLIEGSDELLNTEQCPACGEVIDTDRPIEGIDKTRKIVKCPHCGGETAVN